MTFKVDFLNSVLIVCVIPIIIIILYNKIYQNLISFTVVETE